jgi:hypothetical protein
LPLREAVSSGEPHANTIPPMKGGSALMDLKCGRVPETHTGTRPGFCPSRGKVDEEMMNFEF